MQQEVSFILFGGTGDLTKKKLVPAFSRLVNDGKIRDDSTIIGISRKNLTHDQYKNFLLEAADEKDKKYIKNLDVKYFRGDFSNDGLKGLKELIGNFEKNGCNRIFYLSTSFKFFPNIVKELERLGLHKKKEGFTKIAFEKPFGNDLESSEKLDKEIHNVFREEDIFRLDHYLAKETVQNLNVLKFTNPILYGTLSSKFIESIEIIIDEDIGVGNRIEYYNDAGAIKDMIQSHLLQILSILLMDMPSSFEPDKIHDEKIKILKNLELMSSNHLLGQYKSYKEEAKKSKLVHDKIETFAKVELNCKLPRWDGVKLVLRSGKKLERKFGQIRINFKPFTNTSLKNKIIIDIYPKQDVILLMNTRSPFENSVKQVKFEFCRDCEFGPNTPNEYAVLLWEIIKGDKTLFARSDEVKESWRIVEKIEKIKDKIKFIYYKDNSDPEA